VASQPDLKKKKKEGKEGGPGRSRGGRQAKEITAGVSLAKGNDYQSDFLRKWSKAAKKGKEGVGNG